jgi:tRNA (cytidine/uridine-2'-O-)-methyltransferase
LTKCVKPKVVCNLIHPFGFVINDANLKRSGLDYWVHLDVTEYQNVARVDDAKFQDKSRVFSERSHVTKKFHL